MEISQSTFNKIVKEFKTEILENRKSIKELNDIDYKYNKKIIDVNDLVEVIDSYCDKPIVNIETKQNLVLYYGNPVITAQVLLESIQNSQKVHIVIQNMCYAVNKFLVELFIDILKDYKIINTVSFSNYEGKEMIKEAVKTVDSVYCIGNKNLYTVLKNEIDIKFIPFDCLDIYVDDEEYEDFSREVLNTAIENGYEAEIYEDMQVDTAIKYLNEFGNSFCILILSKCKENIDKIKKELNYKKIFVNENPFKEKILLENGIFQI